MSTSCCPEGKPVVIVTGECSVFTLRFRTSCGDSVDLTGYTVLHVCLKNADGTILEITETINANGSIVELDGNAVLGKLKVTIGAADTALLKIGAKQDISLELDKVISCPLRKNLKSILTIEDSFCP